jgi:hypothetical protein
MPRPDARLETFTPMPPPLFNGRLHAANYLWEGSAKEFDAYLQGVVHGGTRTRGQSP